MDLARAWHHALALHTRPANPRRPAQRIEVHHGMHDPSAYPRAPRNKGKLVGQKAPFKPQEVWAIRVRLQMESRPRELALFDLGIDSRLHACDLVKLRVRDVCRGDRATQGRLLAVSSFGSSCSVADRFVATIGGPGSANCCQSTSAPDCRPSCAPLRLDPSPLSAIARRDRPVP